MSALHRKADTGQRRYPGPPIVNHRLPETLLGRLPLGDSVLPIKAGCLIANVAESSSGYMSDAVRLYEKSREL
jgi:hypothetical protein